MLVGEGLGLALLWLGPGSCGLTSDAARAPVFTAYVHLCESLGADESLSQAPTSFNFGRKN